jgi:MarR family transcriptional regulator, organic hydroperoxide resistance regulator
MATARTPRRKQAAQQARPPTRVLRRFRLVFNAIKAHFRSVERKVGISGAQVWALSVVRDQAGIRVGDLARAMDVHQSTASNLLRALVDAGLVAADRSTADRRFVQLTVTPQGQRLLKKAPGPFTGLLPDALQRLDAATLARLERDLGKLIDELGIDESGASFPLGSDR